MVQTWPQAQLQPEPDLHQSDRPLYISSVQPHLRRLPANSNRGTNSARSARLSNTLWFSSELVGEDFSSNSSRCLMGLINLTSDEGSIGILTESCQRKIYCFLNPKSVGVSARARLIFRDHSALFWHLVCRAALFGGGFSHEGVAVTTWRQKPTSSRSHFRSRFGRQTCQALLTSDS